MTKLCDLGVDDSVCSVGWAQRGTHLAVGTNLGKVQVSYLPVQYLFIFIIIEISWVLSRLWM